ncbi:MAG TPA: hypothetical protein VIU37_10865 [Candidatus Limnocylindrales bacterium]
MPRSAPYGFARDLVSLTVVFPAGTGQVTSLLSLPLGFTGTIEKVSIFASVVAAGAGASRTLNIRKGTATGTVVATATVVLADLNAIGAVKDIPVTAANADFVDTDTLTIEWAAAGAVAFTAGTFHVVIRSRQRLQRVA